MPPADAANTVTALIRNAPAGNVFPTKADIHTPAITTQHVKGLAQYCGAALVGIAQLQDDETQQADGYPFAVVCAVPAADDPRVSPGIGGQVPVQSGLFVTFVMSAWIRELGFSATVTSQLASDPLAARAGLGVLNADDRLVTPQFGAKVYVADPICTDLPLDADG